eukprot:169560_1
MGITNIYNQLSMIQCTKVTKYYINILLHPRSHIPRAILFEKLFRNSNTFCELYLTNPMRGNLAETCHYLFLSIVDYQYPISLHTMRICLYPWIKTNNTLLTIKELTHKMWENEQKHFYFYEYCVFIYFLKLEIECLNTNDINYDIQIVLNQIVHTLWNQWVYWTDFERKWITE